MDHSQVNDQNFIERYVLAQLDETELKAFEEHFLDCPRCLENLETASRLRDSMRTVAAEEAIRLTVQATVQATLWSRLRRALPIAASLVMALSLAFAWRIMERADIANSRAEQAELEASSLAQQLDEVVAATAEPQVLQPPIDLIATRSEQDRPALVLDRGHFQATLVLHIELGKGQTGKLRWQHEGAMLWHGDASQAEDGSLRLVVRKTTLKPGIHLIEQLGPNGETLRRWPFEVL